MITLKVNGESHTLDVDPETPLLWVLRDHLSLLGTKFGCGIMQCGACMVQVDGKPTKSCLLAVSTLEGKAITTIEGLSSDGTDPVQQAWQEVGVPQCGYCQSGQIMLASSLLEKHPQPSDEQIDRFMGNICRCGTYQRMRQAIHRAAELKAQG